MTAIENATASSNNGDLSAGSPSNTSANNQSTASGNFPAYTWLMLQERVLNVAEVKYGIGRLRQITTNYQDENGGYAGSSTRLIKEKVKFKKMVLTNYRIAFLDASNNLFKDKLKTKELETPRWFHFYNMEGFNRYIDIIAANNKDVIQKLYSINPKFRKQYDKFMGLIVPRAHRWLAIKNGLIPTVYLLRSALPITENDFVKEHVGKQAFVNRIIDSMKHGFYLDSLGIDLNELQIKQVSEEKQFSSMKKLSIRFKKFRKAQQYPFSEDGFFIRVPKDEMNDFHNLLQQIQPMIQQVSTLLNDANFIDGIYKRYIHSLT